MADDAERCARGPACPVREHVPTTDGPGHTIGAEAAPGYVFCEACLRAIRYALRAIPIDIAELTMLFAPENAIRYRDPDMPTQHGGGKKHPPLPINGNAEALRALIDHEITCWAESTAEAAGIEWSSTWAGQSRIGARVQAGAQLLERNLPWLLSLHDVEHPARSTGLNPTDGHDEDAVTYSGRDYWIRRNGADAALLFLRLRDQVERFVGRTPADRCPVPCPRCRTQNLFRVHERVAFSGTTRPGTAGHVVCRTCWKAYTDDEYDALSDVTALLFGVRP